MNRWILALVCAVVARAAAEGPRCQSCSGSVTEADCNALNEMVDCNTNQVCQTSIRCTSEGFFVKKGCIGRSKVSAAMDRVVCTDDDKENCAYYCESDNCNSDTGTAVTEKLYCKEKAVGIMCHTCADATSEADCNSAGTKEQCNPSQVCQTAVRCTSDGIVMKKGCVGSIPAASVNSGTAVCTDTTNCALYCDAEECNEADMAAIRPHLSCQQRPIGITCHTCEEASSEEECMSEGSTEQCNPNQVCQTIVRCTNEGFFVKKGCVGSIPSDLVNGDVSCISDTKCASFCDGELCNVGHFDDIFHDLHCPERPDGPECHSCVEGDDEVTCDAEPLVRCNPNQVCQTSIRCLSNGTSLIKKGCIGTQPTLGSPVCETEENEKCAYYCDSETEACNENTGGLVGTVLACKVPGVGPVCSVCDDVDNEVDCRNQNQLETCGRNQVCFTKITCDRPNESVRYKRRCISLDLVPIDTMNITQCEDRDNCSLACDTDFCNVDTTDLFDTLDCPVRPPGIMCKNCKNVYTEAECEDRECRDGNMCYSKVVCERKTGNLRISKRCRRESRVPENIKDTVHCDGNRCEKACDTDDCNSNIEDLFSAMPECTSNPDAETTPLPIETTTPTEDGGGETCTESDAGSNCVCSCTCQSSCTDPPTEAPTTPEPSRPPCTAGMEGPNVLTTYDGSTYTMDTNNKYVVSRWEEQSEHQCKFQVRVDTEDSPEGGAQVGWAGVAFGVHAKNSKKFDRNYRLSLKKGVEIRGRKYNPTELTESGCHQSDFGEEPWTFCADIDTPGTFIIRGEVPTLNCWFQVTYVEGDGSNDMLTVTASEFYDGELNGMCGDRDGDKANDDERCPGNCGDVSVDCVDGAHQFNG